ncbi:hypothetical protein GCM10009809_19070 [Isoptericola hypogeus]|uniref:DUF3472 domain-containing protein n=2 Tax=Isoptericola hypogeus TaxID=300179 RepID=A0ABN2JEB1_9MICO
MGPPSALAAPSGSPDSAHDSRGAVSRAFNNVGITDARTLGRGQLSSSGSSFSASSLADAGYGPGAQVTVGGLDFTMPRTRPGTPDNVAPSTVPTTIKLRGQGNAIAFLATTTSNNRPFNVTVKYEDRTELRTFATTNTWSTQTPDELGVVQDAFRVPGRNTPTTENADADTLYGMFVSGITIDPDRKVREIQVSGNGQAHIFDARIVTVAQPFGVDPRGGRTPQPDSCDPLVEGQGICDAQEAGIFEKADPSAHLQYRTSTGELPRDASAFYNEITPLSSAPGTYFMTNGFAGGYFGIQELEDSSKIAIFSIFGPAKGEVPDDRLASQVLYAVPGGDLVIHGEYAGGPSIRIPFDWDLGTTYSTMITEQGDDSDGNARIVTAWINKNPVGKTPDWTRLMTVRTERPAAHERLDGLYSFVEDFVRDDQFTAGRARTASYGNAFTFSPAKDRWVPLSKVSFTGQMSRLFTIQNDAFPTPNEPCKVTETVTGSSIPLEQARSNVNSIWDTSARSCTSPGTIPPVEAVRKGAPLYGQETFASISAEVHGRTLVVSGSPYANDEPVSVSVDGAEVATTATADATGDLERVRIELPEVLSPGSHELVVTGASSGLSGSTTVTVP